MGKGKAALPINKNPAYMRLFVGLASGPENCLALSKKINKTQSTVHVQLKKLEKRQYVMIDNATRKYEINWARVAGEFKKKLGKKALMMTDGAVEGIRYEHLIPLFKRTIPKSGHLYRNLDEFFAGLINNIHHVNSIINLFERDNILISIPDATRRELAYVQEIVNLHHEPDFWIRTISEY